jgi:transcriptional regulator GlxA family with amidase domain
MSSALPPHVAALGWLATPGLDAQAHHLALPTDLFVATVHCGHAQPALDMSLTLLRTRPERFSSRAAGELAFALITPGGLLALLRAPLDGAADRRIALAEFCGAAEQRALHDALHAEADPQHRTALFGAWIEGRVGQRHRFGVPQQRVAEAAALIQHGSGPPDLAALRRGLRVSQRQLERDFRFWLGVSPAVYARLVRFQRAAMALASGHALSHAAADHAFADQSHLHRAFRRFSALTPREFVHLAAKPRRHAERQALAGRIVVLDAPACAPGTTRS